MSISWECLEKLDNFIKSNPHPQHIIANWNPLSKHPESASAVGCYIIISSVSILKCNLHFCFFHRAAKCSGHIRVKKLKKNKQSFCRLFARISHQNVHDLSKCALFILGTTITNYTSPIIGKCFGYRYIQI